MRNVSQHVKLGTMNAVTQFYAGRLSGMVVRGPDAEPIGRVRDVIVTLRPQGHTSRALGLVVEMVNKKRIFIPMLRIASIEPREINLVSGQVSMRRFQQHAGELSVLTELIGSMVHVDDPDATMLHGKAVKIADVELVQTNAKDWIISKVAVFGEKPKFARRAPLHMVAWDHVQGITAASFGRNDATANLMAQMGDMHPADAAALIHNLSPAQRRNVAQELDDERLADIMQELPDEHQAELIESLNIERAADVLEEMDPDDAADLLGELPDATADVLLQLMEPEEAAPVRQLLKFEDDTVGAIMTTEPVILTPQSTVAEALATVRNPDLATSLASIVFVVRSPTSTPTGHYLGCVHIQRLLREPPSMMVGQILDPDLPPLYASDDKATAARYFAMYNLVCGPVLDENNHLLGAVSVDDLLDHLLPEDWREVGIRP